ncbi:DUF305 domain-containing protein (plasmid) [Anabaena sp. FACHB-709]|uniref:DUF305 domain-containing protein n=2 Tax=Nostocaceae TaxID=1162 RepID=A0A1Z4KVN4_ANAVA|nr:MULTISPECIES: DUF305 domain-containing protein [Nostocaceae]BAY73085.1 hypothetical protein NIES23_59130 [Trichormus variabilis NIES-23]HBW31234.1 DUF305 domain-containing protein [Nostoc sp. UBA8866]MBD2172975.1 DUF305 domain-containing protein [Anabaena cylindrica FACHB-318]MBD2264716.1 DUF305 domain-containing protein [Anabaena sp. FACHB-709]MBD2273935.1 DUF305 domain-containing protein [Nostoc sp. PCC 7120 = FACHB-418]
MNPMQLSTLKNSFLSLTLVAIASVPSGLLTACSTTASQNQSQTPNPTTATDTSDKQPMNHDGMMNHGSGMKHGMAMDLGPADANYDLRFIDAMIPHHQGAVKMANVAQQKSKRPEIKNLADEIIKAQNQEITQMKQWRTAWYPKAGDKPMAYDAKMGHMMEMSSEQMQAMMMDIDLGAADAEFDLRFINAMIPHHEAAVVMAKDALQKSQRPEIKNLAQEIIKAQDTEINQMKQWRKTWYNQ